MPTLDSESVLEYKRGMKVKTSITLSQGLLDAVDKRAGVDHFTDIKSRPEAAANGAERIVRHSGHRGQNDWRPHVQRADPKAGEFAGSGRGHVTIDRAVIEIIHTSPCYLIFV